MNRYRIKLAYTTNPAGTASIMYLGFNYAWGMHYHFRPLENFQVLLGGNANVDLGVKLNSRNVNNPANVDFIIGTNLSMRLIYDIPAAKRVFRLQADLEMPFMGCMFVPEHGATYYEMFILKAPGDFFHFSFLHNRQGVNQRYFVQVPLKSSTWRFGFNAELVKYKANGLNFTDRTLGLFVGYTRTFYNFTRKNPAPANFIMY